MTDDERSDVLQYARQLRDERVLAGDAVLIFQDLILRFGGAKHGSTIVSVAELAGDGIGRSTTYGYLNDLEAAHLIAREGRGARINGQTRRLASRIHIRTAAQAKALALEEAMRQEIAERATASESPESGQEEGVLESNTFYTFSVGSVPESSVPLTADEALAKWLPTLPSRLIARTHQSVVRLHQLAVIPTNGPHGLLTWMATKGQFRRHETVFDPADRA